MCRIVVCCKKEDVAVRRATSMRVSTCSSVSLSSVKRRKVRWDSWLTIVAFSMGAVERSVNFDKAVQIGKSVV